MIRYLTTALTVIALLAWSSTATAATIAWNAPQQITGDTDVSTTGTLAYAINLRGAPFGGSTIVNGVPFFNTGNATGGATVTFQFSNGASDWTTVNGAGSTSAPYINLSADYKALLNPTVVRANPGTDGSLTLKNLTVGTPYEVQLWFNQSMATDGRSIDLLGSPNITVEFNPSDVDGGLGEYAIGTFTADATTQDIDFSGSAPFGVNAFQVRVIPEPTTAALLGLAAMGLLARRRRSVA